MKTVCSIFHRGRRGFTLTEILLAVTIMGLATVGIIAFLRQGMQLYYADRARLLINSNIRSFTSRIDTDAVTANFFCLYKDFNTRATESGSSTVDAALADGQAGDFLVLAYTDPAQTGNGVSMITRLVGYYREVTNTTLNSGPVHRFDIDLSASPVDAKTTPMYSLLNAVVTGSASSYPIVTQLAQGLAINTSGTPSVTPALFYNFGNRSIMIDAQMSESLTEIGTLSQAGNTYNFTVSPRG